MALTERELKLLKQERSRVNMLRTLRWMFLAITVGCFIASGFFGPIRFVGEVWLPMAIVTLFAFIAPVNNQILEIAEREVGTDEVAETPS